MKIFSAIVTAALLAAATPAQAQKVDLSTITCQQFLEMKQDSISLILMWMAGYYSDQDAPPIVDFDKMKEDAEQACRVLREESVGRADHRGGRDDRGIARACLRPMLTGSSFPPSLFRQALAAQHCWPCCAG